MQLLGFRELDQALGRLPEALRRDVVLKALRKAGEPMVDAARARIRRGTDPRKRGSKKQRKKGESATIGAAADSIAIRALRATTNTQVAAAVGPDAAHWYTRFQEFGSAHEPARRWLTPAFEETKETVMEQIGVELWLSMKATAERLAMQGDSGTLSKKAVRAFQS
jgi:HK97 gp10 family phage protein